jgi:flagellar biosynthesis protein FliR
VIDFEVVARFALLLVRPGMLVMLAPALGGVYAPAHVKIGLTVLIALALVPVVGVPGAATNAGLMVVIAREMAIGMSLAFVTRALMVAAEFAGHLAGHQIGFSYGATIDPSSGVRNSTLATLYGTIAIVTFFGINGHHMLMRALAQSYAGMPIGVGQINASLVDAVRHILGLVFTVGLRLAAPMVIVMLVVELAVGLMSRTAPALSAMIIGYPLRLVIGLFVLGVVVATIPGVVSSTVGRVIELGLTTAAAFR